MIIPNKTNVSIGPGEPNNVIMYKKIGWIMERSALLRLYRGNTVQQFKNEHHWREKITRKISKT